MYLLATVVNKLIIIKSIYTIYRYTNVIYKCQNNLQLRTSHRSVHALQALTCYFVAAKHNLRVREKSKVIWWTGGERKLNYVNTVRLWHTLPFFKVTTVAEPAISWV